MSKSFKIKFYILISIIILSLLSILVFYVVSNGYFAPYMKIKGDSNITIEINEPYIDEGVKVIHQGKEMNQNIQMKSNVNTNKIGKYKIIYTYDNQQVVRNIEVVDTLPPQLTLIGSKHLIIFQDEEYEEYGVEIQDNSHVDLTENLSILHNIDVHTLGKYTVTYVVIDNSNNESKIERIVEVVENPMNVQLHYHYDHLDNERIGWWFKKANDHERKPSTYDIQIMNEYHAYYLGNDEKVLYLTFDEGGNDITYIKDIIDVLNEHNVKASFFLTRNYIQNEKVFMNELVSYGHEIGNHTRNHYDMTILANASRVNDFVYEILDTQRTIYEVTKQMPKMIFRFPKGEFSERSLAMVNDLGYSTYFWSHAYNDYSEDVSKEFAYNNLVSHLHNGAIYLLHPSNKGNYEAMEDFILEAKSQGYTFDLVSNIKKD